LLLLSGSATRLKAKVATGVITEKNCIFVRGEIHPERDTLLKHCVLNGVLCSGNISQRTIPQIISLVSLETHDDSAAANVNTRLMGEETR